MDESDIVSLRMERQHLTRKASEAEYIELYRDLQPGYNVYWNGFGDPPSLTYRACFNDIEFNRKRQANRSLIKGRFVGGSLGWLMPEDLELFAAAFIKPLTKPSQRQEDLLFLIEREPLTIQQMKEETKLLVKEITPALHRLQEAFLIYEDQFDGEWDRGWHKFSDMFPDVDLNKYTRREALKVLLQRIAYRFVMFDFKMVKSFYKLREKEIEPALAELASQGILVECENGYILCEDYAWLGGRPGAVALTGSSGKLVSDRGELVPPKFAYAMHRNDSLVKANEHWLKERYIHEYPDTLYYLMIDGVFCGAVVGKFRYTVEVEDVIVDLPQKEADARKEEILQAVRYLCGNESEIKRYRGK